MAWDDLSRDAHDANNKDRDRWIGVYIGLLAMVLAVCTLGGSNATKDSIIKTNELANGWSFFQAKNMRRHVIRVEIDRLELELAAQPALTEDGKLKYREQIAKYRAQEKILTTDPASGEGLDELFKRNIELKASRDQAMQRDPYFDYGQAFLQIAIVLATIAVVAGGNAMLLFSFLFAGAGAFLTFNGYTLLVNIPFVGG
jgi:hypothetical protein